MDKIALIAFYDYIFCEKCNNIPLTAVIMHEEWRTSTEFATGSRFKKFAESYPREYESCAANVQRLINHLNSGIKLSVLAQNLSFFRSEREGLFRIGQSGVKSAKESRLYIYPLEDIRMIFILDIGTKETQRTDIVSARKTIRQIRRTY